MRFIAALNKKSLFFRNHYTNFRGNREKTHQSLLKAANWRIISLWYLLKSSSFIKNSRLSNWNNVSCRPVALMLTGNHLLTSFPWPSAMMCMCFMYQNWIEQYIDRVQDSLNSLTISTSYITCCTRLSGEGGKDRPRALSTCTCFCLFVYLVISFCFFLKQM